MTKEMFWDIIEKANGNAKQLEDILVSTNNPTLVKEFCMIFNDYRAKAYRTDVWFVGHVISGALTDDGFIDFRYWLISKGRKIYNGVLRKPDNIVDLVDAPLLRKHETTNRYKNEVFGYAGDRAYKKLTGMSLIYNKKSKYAHLWDELDLNLWRTESYRAQFPKVMAWFTRGRRLSE